MENEIHFFPCRECAHSAIIFHLQWCPYTGEVIHSPTYQCTRTHKVEHRPECNDFQPREGENK